MKHSPLHRVGIAFCSTASMLLLSGCGHGGFAPPQRPTGAITLAPATLTFIAAGASQAQTLTATQRGNTAFAETDTCGGSTPIASVTPDTSQGSFVVTPQSAGTCTITISGANHMSASAMVGVTTTNGNAE